ARGRHSRDRTQDRFMPQFARGDMEMAGSFAFAQTDDDHFDESAAELSPEVSVRFYAVDHNNPIRAQGFPAKKDRDPFRGGADLLDVEGRPDGGADRLFRDAVACQNLLLSVRGRAAMAPHG